MLAVVDDDASMCGRLARTTVATSSVADRGNHAKAGRGSIVARVGEGHADPVGAGTAPRAGASASHLRAADGGQARTVLAKAEASSPLRFVRPTFPGSSAVAVCLVTFGGGLVDGDALDVDITVERGAALVVFTQSTTKAFRGRSRQTLRANVEGTLVLLPDPVACFRGATYEQRVDIALHGEGSVIAMDGYTAGRPAFGERWAFESLDLATTIEIDGRRVLRDALVLSRVDGPIAPRMDPYDAFVTLVAIGPRVVPVSRSLRAPSIVSRETVAAPSALPCGDGAIVRIAGAHADGALREARRRLRALPEIGVADPFASRY